MSSWLSAATAQSTARSVPFSKTTGRVRRALVVADIAGLTVALAIVERAFGNGGAADRFHPLIEIGGFLLTLPVWIFLAKLYRLYELDERHADHATPDDIRGVFHLLTVGTWSVFAVASLSGAARPEVAKWVVFWTLGVPAVVAARATARFWIRRHTEPHQRTVVVGAGDVGHLVAQKLVKHREYGMRVLGFVDSRPKERPAGSPDLPVLGGVEDLESIVLRESVDRVVVAFLSASSEKIVAALRRLRARGITIDVVPRLFETLGPNAELHLVEGLPVVSVRPASPSRTALRVKRTVDIVLAATALLLLCPLLGYIAIRTKQSSPGPVLYRSQRLGQYGRPFALLKFRTMHQHFSSTPAAADDPAFQRLLEKNPALREEFERTYKLRDDPRVTPFGAFLRRTSLDELPQLVNVLRGDLSLVGPRPIASGDVELAYYGADAPTLLEVPPGVTGFWQINGRSDVSYAERIRLDMAYVSSRSLWLDFMILAKTFRVLLHREGAY